MIYKYGDFIFDDVIPASEKVEDSSPWSQVCNEHLEQILAKCPHDIFYEGVSDISICGVKDCEKESYYYIDFLDEKELIEIDN
jgi:hypothetical protein